MKIKVFSSPLSCILKSIRFLLSVTNKKIIISVAFIGFLNGCVPNTAMLGPVYTFSSTGSVLQTGLSYGSNKVIKKVHKKNKDKKLNKKKNLVLHDFLKERIAKTRQKLKIIK